MFLQIINLLAVIALLCMFYRANKKVNKELNEIKGKQDNDKSWMNLEFTKVNDTLRDIKTAIDTSNKNIIEVLQHLHDVINFEKNNRDLIADSHNQIKSKIEQSFNDLNRFLDNISTNFINMVTAKFADNKMQIDNESDQIKHFLKEIESIVEGFKPSIEEAQSYFEDHHKRYREIVDREAKMRGLQLVRFYQIMNLRNEGNSISKIAQILTEQWGYKVTSNDVSEIIKKVSTEIAIANVGCDEHPASPDEALCPSGNQIEAEIGYRYEDGRKVHELVECFEDDLPVMCKKCSLENECAGQFKCSAAQRSDGKNVFFILKECRGSYNAGCICDNSCKAEEGDKNAEEVADGQ